MLGLPAYGQFAPARTKFELADATLDEIGAIASNELASTRGLLAEAQWDEAVDRLVRLAESGDEKLIQLSGNRYIPLRQYCHRLIGQMPAPALALYRERVDPLAEQWFRAGVASRDAGRLRQVARTMFCSVWGDDALFVLGELALEQGEYAMARAYWERISPLLRGPAGRPLWIALRDIDLDAHWERVEPILLERESDGDWLAYPDTDLSLADVRARLVLVSIRERAFGRAEVELAAFRKLHGSAEGRLGGRVVQLADALTRQLAAARSWPERPQDPGWPTFAGSAVRTRVMQPPAAVVGPAWEAPIDLPTSRRNQSGQRRVPTGRGFSGRRVGEDASHPMQYHPVVVAGLLLHNDARHIWAHRLATGEPALTESGIIYAPERLAQSASSSGRRRVGIPRFTMTARGGRLYARMGDPVTSRDDRSRLLGDEQLVGLDLTKGGQLLFKTPPDDATWAFEGSPIADDRRVYIAMRQSDVTPRAFVAAFDATTGAMLWRTFVASGSTSALPQSEEITHQLLTQAGDSLYYNTNLGVVAALSMTDGRIRWVARYDRAEPGDFSSRAAHFYRDLTPCVFHDGLLFVAPSDSPYLFALDAETGQTMWATTNANDAVHLLGVADGNLIASGDRLWWLDTQSGKVVGRWPENPKDGVRGHGRGCIAGHKVYWPTRRDEVLLFKTRPKSQPGEAVGPVGRIDLAAHDARSGNLLAVDGFLVVTTPDKIYALGQFPAKRGPEPLNQQAAALGGRHFVVAADDRFWTIAGGRDEGSGFRVQGSRPRVSQK